MASDRERSRLAGCSEALHLEQKAEVGQEIDNC
jgi:hypothetical protein